MMVNNIQMQLKESMDSKCKYLLSSFHLGCIIKEASKISFNFLHMFLPLQYWHCWLLGTTINDTSRIEDYLWCAHNIVSLDVAHDPVFKH